MSDKHNLPVVTQQTIAQNEAVENVLTRFEKQEIRIPLYQRDADQWDNNKKSLFIESVLNRLTVPAFYFALSEEDADISEVVDGQQRLTTLAAFFKDEFVLSQSNECPYYGSSSLYAGKKFQQLDKTWQNVFRRYNLTLVTLPETVDLSLRLEIFRRINEGGTPLTGQDIRLSYYSQSQCVGFMQAVGIFNPNRSGSERMLKSLGISWPWKDNVNMAEVWQTWWEDTKGAVGQTASEMFLWYLIGRYRDQVDALLRDDKALGKLKIRFQGNTDEVLDIVCAQLKEEDLYQPEVRLLPDLVDFRTDVFPVFAKWWYSIRMECGPSANVAKHRSIALLIPSLDRFFEHKTLSQTQWGFVSRFLQSSRNTANNVLGVEFPESKGKWTSQRKQIAAYDSVAQEIARR